MNANEYNFEHAKRGTVVKTKPHKQRITIRLDINVLDWFRNQVNQAGGGSYQTLINEALHEYIQERDGMLEKTIRKVIREEPQAADRS